MSARALSLVRTRARAATARKDTNAGIRTLAAVAVLAALAGPAAASAGAASARVMVGWHHLNLRAGRQAYVHGRALPRVPGARALLQVRRGSRWHTLDRARTGVRGRYRLHRRLRRAMSARARVVLRAHGRAVHHGLGRLNVYRAAIASWYGPGLYGNHLACGGRLYAGRLGVANKWLPCGAQVTLRNGRHVVRVRVIDRGPYVAGREFDLTAATAQRLHFRGPGPVQVTR